MPAVKKKKKAPSKTKARVSPKPRSESDPVENGTLDRHDLQRILLEQVVQVAPADIEFAVKESPKILQRARSAGSHLIPEQIELALACINDHLDGTCPQIPLYTIAVLASGLLYLLDEMDLIPDFLPGVGDLDDAAVFSVAMSLARPGLIRYCDATDRALPHF